MFTVAKKGGKLRMVFDGRGPHACFNTHAKSFLSTSTALTNIRLDKSQLLGPADDDERPLNGVIIALDLMDSFYLFAWQGLAPYFAFEHAYPASEFGITNAFDEAGRPVAVAPDDLVFACLETLTMGSSWSLYFCHSVRSRAMRFALVQLGLSQQQVVQQLAVDGRPAPSLGLSRPIAAPYVDNANGLCWDCTDAANYLRALVDVLSGWNLSFRVECRGELGWDTIGLSIDLDLKVITNKGRRVWLLRGAIVALISQGRCSVNALRIVVGHIAYCVQLCRPVLSVLRATYRFVYEYPEQVFDLNEFVLAELGVIAALLPVIYHDSAPILNDTVYVSDASLHGFAFLCCEPGPDTIDSLVLAREWWRFKDERPGPPVTLGTENDEPKVPAQQAVCLAGEGTFAK